MPPLVVLELLPSTKACWANIDAFVIGAYGIGAFDSNSVCKVTCARIALVLLSGFIDSYAEHATWLIDMDNRGKA